MAAEIRIDGIGIAPEVLSAVISRSVEQVEGIACVGTRDLTAALVSRFSARAQASGDAVEAEVVDNRLKLTVHVTVFFGYPFKGLAAAVREAAAAAVDAQVGVDVDAVDVVIDGIVFPKE